MYTAFAAGYTVGMQRVAWGDGGQKSTLVQMYLSSCANEFREQAVLA